MKNVGVIGFGKMGMLHAGIINALNNSRIIDIATYIYEKQYHGFFK